MEQFLIYKSSAGSGKTTALVGVFLRLLLSQPDPDYFRRILAITFTNKATAEMKERLLHELLRMRDMDASEAERYYVSALLIKELQLPWDMLRQRASQAFTRILFDYGDLGISTIDHFNHRLIRSFSRELSLRSDFQVEMDMRSLFHEAVLRVVEQVGSDPDISRHLSDYVAERHDEEGRVDVIGQLEKLQQLIVNDDAIEPLSSFAHMEPGFIASLAQAMKDRTQQYEVALRSICEQAMALISTLGAHDGCFPGKSLSWPTYFRKWKNTPTADFKLTDTLRKNADKPWVHKDAPADVRARIEAAELELRAFAAKAIALHDAGKPGYMLALQLRSRLHVLATINDLRLALEALREERNVLPIAYFNRMVSSSLRNEPVAFIYENLGMRYHHVLVDEFQDTSLLQWQNLLPLVEESLSRGHTAMVVGDAKQSIYRWRGGKAEQLIALPQVYPDDAPVQPNLRSLLNRAAQMHPLRENWRSGGLLIDFNNQFFGALSQLLCTDDFYRKEYDEVAQLIPPAKATLGHIEVNCLGKKPEPGSHAQMVLAQVLQLEALGYALHDICILVRTKKVGSAIANWLMDNGVDVTTSDSRPVDNDPQVRWLLAMLRLHQQPRHTAAAITVMRFMAGLYNLPYLPERYSTRLAETREQYLDVQRWLREHRLPMPEAALFSEGAYQACEHLMRIYLPEAQHNPAVAALLNYMLSKGGMRLTIADFFRQWDGPGEKPSAGNTLGGHSVRMLTIHKAKGLQFKACIIPEVDWAYVPNPQHNEQWVHLGDRVHEQLPYAPLNMSGKLKDMGLEQAFAKEEQAVRFDHLNMLYVAFTRAEEVLMVNYSFSDSKKIGEAVHKAMEQLLPALSGGLMLPLREMGAVEEADDHLYTWRSGQPVAQSVNTAQALPQKRDMAGSTSLKVADLSPKPWPDRFPMAFDRFDSGLSNPRRLGTVFHQLAAACANAAEAELWIAQALGAAAIAQEESKALQSMASALFADEQYNMLLQGATRYPERELSHGGEVLRPDLILYRKDAPERVVIDFKTGEPRPEHLLQLHRYLDAIAPGTEARATGYVLYLEPLAWQEV